MEALKEDQFLLELSTTPFHQNPELLLFRC